MMLALWKIQVCDLERRTQLCQKSKKNAKKSAFFPEGLVFEEKNVSVSF